MNKPLTTSSMPLICKGPMTDTAVAAMARLESTQGLDLEQHQPLPAQIQQWQTDEGAKVSFTPSHDRPIFDLALRFRAGSALDGNRPGLAALVLYSLDQGTEGLDAAQFAQAIEGLGAIMARQMNQDEAVITLRCLSLPALRTSALQLLTQMLARPAFREEAVAGIRERLLNYLGAMASTPVFGMSHATMSHVFDGHPYATHWAGTPESLNQIDEQQLRDFHRRAYSANNLDIGLVGDLSRDEAQTLITELLQALPQHWAGQPPPPAPLPEALTRHQEHTASTTRATLTLLLPISPDKPGYAALTMLDEILGSGFESRLTQELRSRRTLTYTIRSSLKPFDAASLLQIEWDIAPEYRDASRDLISGMLACLREHGPSQAECDMACNQIAGRLHRTMVSNAELAESLATSSHLGQPADHFATYIQSLAALTPKDIREAARVWLSPAQEVFITVGPSHAQKSLPELS
ncbi:M16 family metallopeptidase [Pseudomonas sp. GD03746]|uniref:M16 family metallopeptidase n=1 Tax=Pseudomonas sp. GD03746 TaxID=2975378 RepID=UPI00244ADC4C|nr:pitrilysin family protein [Pseudomonas sp. GD03746]MDH1572314.1 insulinase family protein [Pseudomonas sp. GD03746]HEN8713350.1 insulinase family protein [Pseudomonas putida]HEN8718287.1 insulinase family protein [Pseudomonas putida]